MESQGFLCYVVLQGLCEIHGFLFGVEMEQVCSISGPYGKRLPGLGVD